MHGKPSQPSALMGLSMSEPRKRPASAKSLFCPDEQSLVQSAPNDRSSPKLQLLQTAQTAAMGGKQTLLQGASSRQAAWNAYAYNPIKPIQQLSANGKRRRRMRGDQLQQALQRVRPTARFHPSIRPSQCLFLLQRHSSKLGDQWLRQAWL